LITETAEASSSGVRPVDSPLTLMVAEAVADEVRARARAFFRSSPVRTLLHPCARRAPLALARHHAQRRNCSQWKRHLELLASDQPLARLAHRL